MEHLEEKFEELCMLLSERLPQVADEIGQILYSERCEQCGELAPGGKCKHHYEEPEHG